MSLRVTLKGLVKSLCDVAIAKASFKRRLSFRLDPKPGDLSMSRLNHFERDGEDRTRESVSYTHLDVYKRQVEWPVSDRLLTLAS